MPPKVKKTRKQSEIPQYPIIKEEAMEEEKENNCFDNPLNPNKIQPEEKKVEGAGKLYSQPSTPEMELKPAGFWSKKLQDLEENNLKNKRRGLYEFSGTDESESSYKIRKKPRQKTRLKKKQCIVPKYNKAIAKKKNKNEPEKKVKLPCKLALGPEQVMLSKEKKEVPVEGKKLTFSTAVQSFAITSTPAVNKNNLIGASNFLFLSPIIKEEAHYSNSLAESSPPGSKVTEGSPLIVHSNKQTPRVETKLKRFSCRRVLRSGKMLNT